MASRKKKASHSSNPGCLIFLVGFIVLGAIFAIKFPDIKATLDSTKFLDLVKQRATTTTTLPSPEILPSDSTVATTEAPASQPPAAVAPQPTLTTLAQPATESDTSTKLRQSRLFFVKIEDDGIISSREVKRNIPVSDSPLSDAINALITGPSEGEIRSGLVSLIPHGTKLLGITVRGSTAIIDLSDAFMYNHYGVEGYSAQLKQVVYTATSFPSVQDVQILVEGKQKDYMGGEGVFIGKPLSRNSF